MARWEETASANANPLLIHLFVLSWQDGIDGFAHLPTQYTFATSLYNHCLLFYLINNYIFHIIAKYLYIAI